LPAPPQTLSARFCALIRKRVHLTLRKRPRIALVSFTRMNRYARKRMTAGQSHNPVPGR